MELEKYTRGTSNSPESLVLISGRLSGEILGTISERIHWKHCSGGILEEVFKKLPKESNWKISEKKTLDKIYY